MDIDHVLKEYKESASQVPEEETTGDGPLDDGSTDGTVGSSTCSRCPASQTETGLVASTATATIKEASISLTATATVSAAAESASASPSVGTSEGSVTVVRSWFGVVLGLIVGVGCIV